MGLQDIISGRFGQCRYQKLEERPPRRRWKRKPNRQFKGFRIPRSRKFCLKPFSLYTLSSRIARIYGEIMSRLNVDGACPSIVFSTQWGLPILSHSLPRKAAMAIDRSLVCF